MRKFHLFPIRSGYSHQYDPKLSPGLSNIFATAAFRYIVLGADPIAEWVNI